MGGLKHLREDARLRDTGLLNLEKISLRRDLLSAHQELKGGIKRMGTDSSQQCLATEQVEMETNWNPGGSI